MAALRRTIGKAPILNYQHVRQTILKMIAKVLQHLLKCFFLIQNFHSMIMMLTSPIICLAYNGVAYDYRALTKLLRQPPIFNVTGFQYLTFYAKKVLINGCFQKQKGRQNHIRLSYLDINVHYVYVTSLIFDVIGRLNTTENR